MEPHEGAEPDRLDYLEARVRTLEERIPATRLLDRRFMFRALAVLGHFLVAGLIIYVAAFAALGLIGVVGFGLGPFSGVLSGEAAVPEGPPLGSVADLPVDASGTGTIQGAPTGKATTHGDRGSFVLVLEPAPAGLPARTTLSVAFDRSTKVYRDAQLLGDPLDAMNSEGGTFDADPTAAGSVVVQFRIKDGRVFADRLDLSDEFPPGIVP